MENYKPDQALACTAAALECGLGLGLCGVVLGDARMGVANMLMRLSIIEMERYERLETGIVLLVLLSTIFANWIARRKHLCIEGAPPVQPFRYDAGLRQTV